MRTLGKEHIDIKNIEQFRELFIQVKTAVKDGILRQVPYKEHKVGRSNLDNIPAEGPFPDIVKCLVEEIASGMVYELYAPIYKGGIGTWTRLRERY